MFFTIYSNKLCFDFLIYSHSLTRSTQTTTYTSHAHNGYELIYIVEGCITYGLEEQEINLKPGDIIITPSQQYHLLQVLSNEDYERINLIVFPEALNLNLNLDHVVLLSEHDKTFKRILKDFPAYYDICSPEQQKEIFEIKTRELIFAINHLLPNNDAILDTTVNETLKGILNYINANIYNNITVTDISNHCFLSEGHIFHLFRKKLKTSPMNYIKTKKMLLAQSLISTAKNQNAIMSIASDLGFYDYSVFYRNYLKFFNHKPSDDLHKSKTL